MREILFRGKTSRGKWIEGYFSKESDGSRFYIQSAGRGICYIVNPETVGQFTGLLDKNDNKIFEGDIVLSSSNSEQAVVKWGDYSACFLLSFNGWCADFDIPYELEVIGNVHDNPELLKGETPSENDKKLAGGDEAEKLLKGDTVEAVADVQAVKHGKWRFSGNYYPTKNWICSECAGMVIMPEYCWKSYYNYCPNCGAKMDGD